MDEMKKKNIKDYTVWDLNPSCFKPKTKRYLSKKFKRFARRRLNRELRRWSAWSSPFFPPAD